MFSKPSFRFCLMIFLAGALCLVGAAASWAQGDDYESHADKFAGGYTDARNCLICHKNAADEVIHSVHYQWRSENPRIEYPGGGSHGMVDRACGLVGSNAIINYDQRCGKCHVGDTLPFPDPRTGEFSLEQKHNLDCLICHAAEGQYDANGDGEAVAGELAGDRPWRMDETRGREAWHQDRRAEAAQSVGGPVSNEACLRCHHHGQADPTYKRGTPYEAETDVHAAMGMRCTTCHEVDDHKIASGVNTSDMYAVERTDVEVTCTKCHTDAPHKTQTKLNDHTDRIACETCHIPEVAGAQRRVWTSTMGVTEGDESEVPTFNSETGEWEPFTVLDEGLVSPSYRWYSGAASMLAEPIDKPWAFDMRSASKQTPGAKITPFRKFVSGMAMDANGIPGAANFNEMFTMGAALGQMAQGLKMMGFMRPDGMTVAEEAMMGMFPNMLLFDRADYFANGGMADAVSIGMAKMGALFQGMDASRMTREELIGMGSQMWSGNVAGLDLPDNPMAPGAVDDDDPRTVTGSFISVSHSIKLEGALNCADCHTEDGRLDFAELGYSEEMSEILTGVLDDGAPDHSNFIAEYSGPTQCQMCHPGKIAEMQGGTHYKLESDLPEGYQYDHDGNPVTFTRSGKLWKLCGFPTAFPQANWLGKLKDLPETDHVDKPGGCGKCHIGIGIKPYTAVGQSEPQENEAENVDCLMCHAADYNRKFYIATEGGEPLLNALGSPVVMAVPQTDGVRDFSVYTEAAKTVGHTSAATCLRCHVAAGGGKLAVDDLNEASFKRGSFYTPEMDVHAAAGLSCSDCHYAGGHRFKRPLNNDLSSHDVIVDHQMCIDCHGEAPHALETYNSHLAYISCTSCHTRIPGGVVDKDFSQPVAPDPEDPLGTYGLVMVKTTNTAAVKYTWFNGSVGPELEQRGSRDDGLIYPFKQINFNQPLDASGHPIPVKWGKFFLTGDMEAAVALGRGLYESMYTEELGATTGIPPIPGEFDHYGQNPCGGFSISHGITKTNALTCNECHSADGPMDFAALGYDEEKQVELMAMDWAPTLTGATDRGDGSVDLAWSHDGRPAPQRFLGFAYDYYTGEWVERGRNGGMWYHFADNTFPGNLDIGNTGLFSFWISAQYPDGTWFPTASPETLILLEGTPHAPLEVAVSDQGENVVELTWKPDQYGTWVYWVILYDVANGQWVQANGPLGDSLWQYAVWGSDGFNAGSMELELPASGPYFAFIAGMGWDGETLGAFESVLVNAVE